jgi:hypothetical protein
MATKVFLTPDRSGKRIPFLPGGSSSRPVAADLSYEIEEVGDVSAADVVLAPQPFSWVDGEGLRYLAEAAAVAEGKPLAAFVVGDLNDRLTFPGIPNLRLLKKTRYVDEVAPDEVIVPPITKDWGAGGVTLRPYRAGEAPVVGFCGWSRYSSWLAAARHEAEALLRRALGRKAYRRAKGVHFRRRVIAALRSADRAGAVSLSLVERSAYGGQSAPDAHREFGENLRGSDLALAVKGDANYSIRFFEALSAGRPVLLVDTDVALPFADRIDYDAFVVRVPLAEVARAGGIARAWWDAQTADSYAAAQRAARAAFENFLRHDRAISLALATLR